jgi:hypothetical protein
MTLNTMFSVLLSDDPTLIGSRALYVVAKVGDHAIVGAILWINEIESCLFMGLNL